MAGIGSGQVVAAVGCVMVVAAGTEDTEAIEALCLDLCLRMIPNGKAKLPGATNCSGTFSVDVSEVIIFSWAMLRSATGGRKDSSLSSSLSLVDVAFTSAENNFLSRRKNGLPTDFVARRREEMFGADE